MRCLTGRMEYTYQEPPEKHNGQHWFGHEVSFWLATKRREECWAYLDDKVGPKGTTWRLKDPRPQKSKNHFFWDPAGVDQKTTVRFTSKSMAAFFKLTWEEDENLELAWKRELNNMYGLMKSMTGVPTIQSLGRGLRSVNMKSVRPLGAPITPLTAHANPMPWLHSQGMISNKTMMKSLGLTGKDIDSIISDHEASYLKYLYPTVVKMTKKNERHMSVIKGRAGKLTTDELMLRLSDDGIQQQETSVSGNAEALPERLIIVDEVQQVTRAQFDALGL